MGEHQSTFRILGASAVEVLQTVVGQLPVTARVTLGHGGLIVDERWCIDGLEARNDGVVVLHVHDSASVGALPATWLVYKESSCSRGIDYESIDITRGGEILLSLVEMPDGDLVARVGDRVIEEIRRPWTEDGERIPAEGDEVTWAVFRDRHLARIAPSLGDGAVVLSAADTAPPEGVATRSGGDVSSGDDDLPF